MKLCVKVEGQIMKSRYVFLQASSGKLVYMNNGVAKGVISIEFLFMNVFYQITGRVLWNTLRTKSKKVQTTKITEF